MNNDIDKKFPYRYCSRFGQIAVELGLITKEQLKEGLAEQVDNDIARMPHKLLPEIFLEKGWMTNKQVLQVLNKIFKYAETQKPITELEEAEERLRENEKLFYALFNQATDSIFLMDPTHEDGPIILDVNKSACTIHGYTREELIGKHISFLDDPETIKQIPQRTRSLIAGEALTFEAGHVRKNGSTFPVEVSAQVIQLGGKPYILAIDRDITERKKMEKELKDRIEELEKFYKTAIDRELKMDQLKEEIKKLKSELSQYKK